ncbi:hypothetical protein ACXGQW_08765 [Wenyingzhuangia sp. IMCC45533]
MLGILLLYFIGKKFYTLAEDYDKQKWKYTIFGILSYYGGVMVGGFLLGIIDGLFLTTLTTTSNVAGILFIPFGITSCYLLYRYCDKKFNEEANNQDSINDIGNGD